MENSVLATPSKRFFVNMLTRDIELKDAILDLLDNCIDGVHRHITPEIINGPLPYSGFFAEITATSSEFRLVDNCGGIPLEIARTKAFVLGRPEDGETSDVHSVGMYGIGMKRAIFKLGRNSIVSSNPIGENNPFQVCISREWMNDNNVWVLPLELLGTTNDYTGTKILVNDLNASVASNFAETNSPFLVDLSRTISKFYAAIFAKGFTVKLNGKIIIGSKLEILNTPAKIDSSGEVKDIIEPFAFVAKFQKVDIEIVIGFRTPLKSAHDIDEENEQPRTTEDAGITVICNDRVVLYNDKSYLTGWGRVSVPRYHTQFISISGFVLFRSTDLYSLPVTTTKRGLETDNPAYVYALEFLMEGIKKMTDFTNKWKGREEETTQFFAAASPVAHDKALTSVNDGRIFREIKTNKESKAHRHIPNLPQPVSANPMRRIVFSRNLVEIKALANYFYPGEEDINPRDVGNKAFQTCLEMTREVK